MSGRGKSAKLNQWSDLPQELLSQIANRLGLIELIRFRLVCKDFLRAASTATAQVEATPWFLEYGKTSQCSLFRIENEACTNVYDLDLPELQGAICLASSQGWLLLYRQGGQMFFFCPFSRLILYLPLFPSSKLSNFTSAAFSPPTSPDCMILVVRRLDDVRLELNLFRRGYGWYYCTKCVCGRGYVKAACYYDDTFYFLCDEDNGFMVFRKDLIWKFIRTSPEQRAISVKTGGGEYAETGQQVPFLHYSSWAIVKELLSIMRLKGGTNLDSAGQASNSIAICGTLKYHERSCSFMSSEIIKGSGARRYGVWILPRYFQNSGINNGHGCQGQFLLTLASRTSASTTTTTTTTSTPGHGTSGSTLPRDHPKAVTRSVLKFRPLLSLQGSETECIFYRPLSKNNEMLRWL